MSSLTNTFKNIRARCSVLFGCLLLSAASAQAQVIEVRFSTDAAGITKGASLWGVDTSWISSANIQTAVSNLGNSNIDYIRVNFSGDQVVTNGQLTQTAKDRLNQQLSVSAPVGKKGLALSPNSFGNGVNSWYRDIDGVNTDRWRDLIVATARYLINEKGQSIAYIEPFNEPDYTDYSSKWDFYYCAQKLQAESFLSSTKIVGPSAMSSNVSVDWYNHINSQIDWGTTHAIYGSMDTYITMMGKKSPYNTEVHSLAELIVGVNYGMKGGTFWGGINQQRGQFCKDSQSGKQLGYAENRVNWTAAAVYRGSDGKIRGYASGSERTAASTTYRFYCTNANVSYNGGTPRRDHTVTVTNGQDVMFTIVRQ